MWRTPCQEQESDIGDRGQRRASKGTLIDFDVKEKIRGQ